MNNERNSSQNNRMLTRKTPLERHLAPQPPSLLGRLMRFLFWSGLTAVVLFLGLLTFVSFAGRLHWAFDAFSNFRLYYFVTLLALALFALWRQKYWFFWPTGILALLNFLFIAPYYISPTAVVRAETQPPHNLRLLMANVFYYNPEPESLLRYIDETDPDIIVLVEMTSELKMNMRTLQQAYPYVLDAPYQENIILSRVPPTEMYYDHTAGESANAVAHFNHAGQPFTLIGAHTSTPLGRYRIARRNTHLTYLATVARTIGATEPVIVTGDLNTTPFSVYFQDLLRDGQLHDGRYGHGLHNTWPSFNPLVRIPLDHFLHSDDIDVHHFTAGPFNGSDHRPILIDFSLR